jgi:hypothetical protein
MRADGRSPPPCTRRARQRVARASAPPPLNIAHRTRVKLSLLSYSYTRLQRMEQRPQAGTSLKRGLSAEAAADGTTDPRAGPSSPKREKLQHDLEPVRPVLMLLRCWSSQALNISLLSCP